MMRALLIVAGAHALVPTLPMRYSRRPTALGALKLEGDAKKAMTEVREKIGVREDGDFYDLDAAPWAAIRDDFPALASLSDEELRARLGANLRHCVCSMAPSPIHLLRRRPSSRPATRSTFW